MEALKPAAEGVLPAAQEMIVAQTQMIPLQEEELNQLLEPVLEVIEVMAMRVLDVMVEEEPIVIPTIVLLI